MLTESIARPPHSTKPSNAPDTSEGHGYFWVTHPYHPLSGQRLALVQYRQTWGEHRVYFHDQDGHLCSLPVSWTSLAALDPFVALAAGRSLFRVADLLALRTLCAHLMGAQHPEEAP